MDVFCLKCARENITENDINDQFLMYGFNEACRNGNTYNISLLIQKRRIEGCFEMGLLSAIHAKKIEAIELLLRMGAQLNEAAFEDCCRKGNEEIINAIFNYIRCPGLSEIAFKSGNFNSLMQAIRVCGLGRPEVCVRNAFASKNNRCIIYAIYCFAESCKDLIIANIDSEEVFDYIEKYFPYLVPRILLECISSNKDLAYYIIDKGHGDANAYRRAKAFNNEKAISLLRKCVNDYKMLDSEIY